MERGKIRNIIFDLGGVIVDLDPPRTFSEFAALSGKPVEEIVNLYHNTMFFRHYETGRISDETFRNSIREALAIDSSDEQIDHAWNAILVGMHEPKKQMLLSARKKFNIFLLSNTNHIHTLRFERFFDDVGDGLNIHSIFKRVYYSFSMNLRKPDPEIFEYVISDNNLDRSQTLLVDDNRDNIESARNIGLKVLQVEMNQPVIDIPEQL